MRYKGKEVRYAGMIAKSVFLFDKVTDKGALDCEDETVSSAFYTPKLIGQTGTLLVDS